MKTNTATTEICQYYGLTPLLDPDGQPGKLVFNRTITLRDTWAKESDTPPESEGSPIKGSDQDKKFPPLAIFLPAVLRLG
jgi:hypothetical protein